MVSSSFENHWSWTFLILQIWFILLCLSSVTPAIENVIYSINETETNI